MIVVNCRSSRKTKPGRIEKSISVEVGDSHVRYLVIIEEGKTSFGAYVPDLPSCIAVGETRQVARLIHRIRCGSRLARA